MTEQNGTEVVDSMAREKEIWNNIMAESGIEPPNPPQPNDPTNEPPTPPANDPPANEPPVTPTATQVEITDEIRLKEINSLWGTEFKSIDEFKAKKTELDELPTYKSKVEELSKNPPKKYASAVVEELNNFIAATGIDDIRVSKELKRFEATTEKDPIEAMVLAEIVKDPTLLDKKELLRKTISSQYNVAINPDLEGDELRAEQERVELVKFKMERDAKSAFAAIDEVGNKVKNYKDPDSANAEQSNQKREQTKALWSETFDKVGKDIFKSVEISVPVGKDKDGKEQFKAIDTIELTPTQQAEAIARVVEIAAANNFELTNENLQSLVNAQKEVLAFQNYRASVAKYVDARLAEERLNWEKGIYNPSSTKIELPTEGQQGTEERDFFKAVDTFLGK